MNKPRQILQSIKKNIQHDSSVEYGYYGSQASGLKRMLFWSRLQTAMTLYEKHCQTKTAQTIIDFGCQFAFVSAAMARQAKHIYLTEISQTLLDLGIGIHQKYGQQNFTAFINPEDEPALYVKHIQPGEKIDLFLMFDVLEHVRAIDALLHSLREVANPQAKILISLPTENFFYMFLNRFKREVGHCHRYFEITSRLEKMQIRLLEKKSLWGLFHIYLYEI